MIQTLVSKILWIPVRGSNVVMKNSSRFNSCNEVRARSYHGESGMRYRSTCPVKVRRSIHTTPPNNVHPLIWVVLRPIAKLSAMVVGRGVRKWWGQLPQNKKALFMQAINRRKFRILGAMAFIGGTAFIYYETHLQEVPIVKRRRFHAFNSSQIQEIAKFQYEMCMENYEGKTFSASHPRHIRVENVVKRIVNANRDIPEVNDKSWNVTVVESPIQNAFVLPNGQIFVLYGILDLMNNDDQLAVVLGHEMAHAVLNHGDEMMSYLHLLDLFTIALIGVIWAILPTDLVSALVQWMMHKFLHVLMELPFSRQLEIEADEIGLLLSTKACFDVREHSAFYQRLAAMQKDDGNQSVEWLSTHPDHEVRSAVFEEKLSQAMSLRLACKCPPLPAQDPRITVIKTK